MRPKLLKTILAKVFPLDMTPGVPPQVANTYYVAKTGLDTNPGTSGSPFLTIGKAASVVVAGDTVIVNDGTYNETVAISASGTSGNRITFKAATKWGAKVVSPGTGYTSAFTVSGDYVDVIEFDITGGGSVGLDFQGSQGRAYRNKVHDIPVPNQDGFGGAGIAFPNYSGNKSGGLADGNVVYNIGGYGGATAYNKAQGIYPSINNVSVVNNLIYRVRAYAIDFGHAASTGVIENNTIFSCGQSVASASNDGGGIVIEETNVAGAAAVSGFSIRNNIIYDCQTGYGLHEEGTTGVNTYTNNCSFGNYSNWGPLGGSTHSADVSSDPLFYNYQADGSGDYRLTIGSPCLNAGVTANVTTDALGQSRPLGASIDLGAFESQPYLIDQVATAQYAFSTRLLSSTYTGSCLRVRRSSDNAEQDIGFASGVIDTAALATFVGSDSAYVTTWYDQSGNGLNAVQATATRQPMIVNAGTNVTIGGKVAMLTDGVDDYLRTATPTSQAQPCMRNSVFEFAVFPGTGFPTIIDNAATESWVIYTSVANMSSKMISSDNVFKNSNVVGQGFVGMECANGASTILRANATETARTYSTGNMIGLTVGCARATNTFSSHKFGEIIGWKSIPNATNRTALHTNQKAYWSTL